MIDIIKQTPIEYSKQSRDYQVLARMYTALFNLNKMYTDNMHVWNKDIDNKLTTLRAKTLNFNPNHSWGLDALEAAVSCFKYIMFRKGTLDAIYFCIYILLRINKLESKVKSITIDDDYNLEIKIPVRLASIGIVQDLLDYILPAGITYRIKEYQSFDEKAEYTLGYSNSAKIINKDIDFKTLGIANSYDESSEGPYNQGYTIHRNFVNRIHEDSEGK